MPTHTCSASYLPSSLPLPPTCKSIPIQAGGCMRPHGAHYNFIKHHHLHPPTPQEPINAHSHLLSIMIGNTQTVPVSEGKLCLGTWQVRQGSRQ